mmetsp:Transcript_22270/g.44185  ORF Transcript_22270/g.44185 Transcript_22270/m.44185 type:complete len:311 (-) Transcript_22270:153-1085(-)|eukprot:CAMPEP_0175145234 /NCGR_PEP_ID=MMETSP0087-20121206/14633_1 /TAXON_ID=136419 /ORGANISM="Unknown Unknown, Strain D1" /LENGTH=310 /DNA_ID=CAMNT_0016429909 /DNA_START=35 /DNA_END=967 /DNA_ORIENTATION=+
MVNHVLDLKSSLEAAVKVEDNERTLEILGVVKDLEGVTQKLLKTTQIGVAVGKLRKSQDGAVKKLASEIVALWKSVCSGKTTSTPTSNSSPAMTAANSSATAMPVKPAEPAAAPPADSESVATDTIKAKEEDSGLKEQTKVEIGTTGDKMRDKYQGLLCKALGEGAELSLRQYLAVEIEAAMFRKWGDAQHPDYKEQTKQLLFNLRDPSNEDLNNDLVSGALQPREVAVMNPTELASQSTKEQRQKSEREAIDSSRTDWDDASDSGWTDVFKCPKCHMRKVKFKQKQIRCADEPMTTFLFCGECKFRWTD